MAEPWARLTGRWRNGGVEEYPLGQSHAILQMRRLRIHAAFELTEHRMALENLSESFRGFRIVHLTDIHHGVYFPAQALKAVVELTNEIGPDLVAITGDFVTHSRAYIEPAAEILGGLRAHEGVFAVLGNHDFRVGAEQISRALDRQGIQLLRNRHTELSRGGQNCYLAGIDDFRYRADLGRALRGVPRNAPTILLSHNPRIIGAAAKYGVGLVLSGHTHGGQVRLPVVGSIYGRSGKRSRFKSGRDSLGSTQIYVSRGIGTVLLPVRYGCPSEIPHFVLEPDQKSDSEYFRFAPLDGWHPARQNAHR
ncbi:MAG TPA: metallophosphoesterase [Candidatus Acidoferrales bacterium]|nr:metallophosphoesterase [Candidatus Acidoferrales bacterium]